MKKMAGLLGLVIALGIGWYIFKMQMTQGPTHGAPPKEVINVVGIKGDLISIGNAERMYLASHGSYATLQQLHQDGSLTFSGSDSRGYHFDVQTEDGQHFKVTASPSDPAQKDWPTLSIDDSMQITQQ